MKRPMTRLERSLYRKVTQAVREFELIEDGDRLMVCLSGGKDSYALLHFLEIMRHRAPIRFELLAVHLDQVQPGYDGTPLRRHLEARETPFRVLRHDTYSIVRDKTEPGQAYCFLCSRLRRGILYQAAQELGCTRIALGHHRDDALETLMLNLVYSGQLKSMPPKLISDDGRNVVIRPLIYCPEDELAAFSVEQRFPILPCNLCGSQSDLKRDRMKQVLDQIESVAPGARSYMLAALTNVRPTHLLDRSLWSQLELPGLTPTSPRVTAQGKRISSRAGAEGSEAQEQAPAGPDPLSPVLSPSPPVLEGFDVDDLPPDADPDTTHAVEVDNSPRPVFFHDALGLLD